MKERGNAKLKLLDKVIGIPLVFALGAFRKKKKRPSTQPKNIMIVMIAAIGDTILLSAIIKELKRIDPNINITLVCSNGNWQAARNIPHINQILKFDMSNIGGSLALLRKQEVHDLLLDFGAWSRLNAFISFCIKAKYKVGFRRKRMFRHYLYDHNVEHVDDVHEIENYRNLLRSLGLRLSGLSPQFTVPAEIMDKMKWMLDPKQKYIIFHFFASGSHKAKKEWPESSWLELANRLIREQYKILLTGGKQDREMANDFVEKVNGKESANCLSLAGKLSLEETAALIKAVGGIITVNTGIMHLAAAMDSRIIALHGPTAPLRWGPVSEKSIILTPRIKCDQLLSLGFEKHHCVIENGCISTIEVNDVYQAVKTHFHTGIGDGLVAKTSSVF